jgi:hypothetical protein
MAEVMKWYLAKGEKALGPFDLARLRQMAASGAVGRDDLVCPEGGSEWVAATTVPGLFPSPPPLPQPPAPTAPGLWERFTGGIDGAFGASAKVAGWGCGALIVLYVVLMVGAGVLKNVRDNAPPKPDLPVHVSFRTSDVGRGMVLKIKNTSATPIKGLTFTITSEGGQKAGSISKVLVKPLEPQATFEVGWAELDGWELKAGERVQIWVASEEYKPVEVVVPAKAPVR